MVVVVVVAVAVAGGLEEGSGGTTEGADAAPADGE